MKILYDSAAFLEPYGGVSRYFTELVKHLPDDMQGVIAAAGTDNIYLQESPFHVPQPKCSFRSFWPKVDFRGKLYVYRTVSRLLPCCYPAIERVNEKAFFSRIGDCDVVHLTAPHRYEGLWKKCAGQKPVVVTVHDLIPDLFWKDPRYRIMRGKVLKAVDHVIAVSQHTKEDLVRLYGVPEDKVTVVYHGYTEPDGQDLAPVFPDMRYLLYVGRRGGYKNSDFFFHAVIPLLKADPTLNLVCTGAELSKAELFVFGDAGVEKQVHQKFISDRSMISLFRHAQCFVYPSKYEGFGIPILDAFAAECPVVLSDCSCFPEIGGDAAVYFKDGDAEGLRQRIREVMGDTKLRNVIVSRGVDRLKLFSWRRCAEETAEVYRRVWNEVNNERER